MTDNGASGVHEGPHSAARDVSFARPADSRAESSRPRRLRSAEKEAAVETGLGRLETGRPGSSRRRSGLDRGHDSLGERPRDHGGFLVESALGDEQPREKSTWHGRINKAGSAGSRRSGHSSLRSSPLSLHVSRADAGEAEQPQQRSPPSSMDPAQLVQMALNLSESRRRHVSGSLPLPLPSPSPRISKTGADKQPESAGKRRSNGTGHAISPELSPTPQRSAAKEAENRHRGQNGSAHTILDVPHSFSPATLSRAEKARKYFELASEHRRLLQHLPPLKPEAHVRINDTDIPPKSPDSAHSDMKRVPPHASHTHALGRAYNPLQALRNRRLRARERLPLPAPPESWQDTERIRHWIDNVEAASKGPGYRAAPDKVRLPQYAGEAEHPVDARENAKGHRRTDTTSTIITRPENGWAIEPPELLADAYWTEKGDNKASIESRSGSHIFASLTKSGVEKPRRSHEISRSVTENEKEESQNERSADKRRSRPTRLLPRSRKRAARSTSSTGTSADEGRAPPSLRHGDEAHGDENVAPLKRHMEEMIAKYQRGELVSPKLVSPDHWDSKHTQFPVLRGETTRHAWDDVQPRRHSSSLLDTGFKHRRAKSADGRVSGNYRAITPPENMSPGEPTPLAMQDTGASLGIYGSSPTNEGLASPQRKSKLHRLPLFHAHDKERTNADRTDTTTNGEAQASDLPRSSMDSTRLSLIGRHKTAEVPPASQKLQDITTISSGANGSSKESTSTVGRLLKGRRIGELVRIEGSRLSGRLRNKDQVEEANINSDISSSSSGESEDEGRGKVDVPTVVGGDDGESPRASFDRGRGQTQYHLQNLPSFKSAMGRSNAASLHSADDDHISLQQRARREAGRSPRFDRLAPPRIVLPTDESHSPNPDVGADVPDASITGKNEELHQTLSRASSSNGLLQRPASVPGLGISESQRKWSISDKARHGPAKKVTMRDVARVQLSLLSAGVNAQAIQRQATLPRDKPLAVIQRAAEFVGQNFGRPPKMGEHVVASHYLHQRLDATLSDFEKSVDDFRRGPAQALASQLDELQQKASDQLTKFVHDTSDEADAFIVELNSKQPQDVKRVNDAIDDLLRQRRRKFLLLRKTGFKLLEWMVLGILWWVWFVVLIINTFRRAIVGVVRFLRWLFWF